MLAKVALAAPAVVALRALSRLGDGAEAIRASPIRNHAGSVAWAFRSLFNLPEVTAMLRRDESDESYWQRVLEYSAAGALQSVMDEVVHVLNEWEGVAHRPLHQATRVIASRIVQALPLRTATVGLDEIRLSGDRIETTDRRMRARYAARFGARQIDEGAGAVRADDVRGAFNSPFWPFVLCSTSVGQEGLDFHLYLTRLCTGIYRVILLISSNARGGSIDIRVMQCERTRRCYMASVRSRQRVSILGRRCLIWQEMRAPKMQLTWIRIGCCPRRMARRSSAMFLRCPSAEISTVVLPCEKR